MDDATRAVLELWDVAEEAVDGLAPEDWSRPAPGAEPTVGDLVAHLAGVHADTHYAAPDRQRASLADARRRTALAIDGRHAGDRVLGAHCLDLCLHAHDLTTALGAPVDLGEHPAAALEACRLIVDVAPRLLVAALGPRDATVRLVVRRPDGAAGEHPTAFARTVHIVGGRCAGPAPHTAPDVVEVDADALLLLLAGRRPAESLAADGAAAWSGTAADAFVHRARLVG
ncbi:hypothetical protein [Actinomycetospora cinnamomea]|uniref:Mycothiol maleylpyruvate isomerase-like protein n=1 Tax=Actinomycetospora cinnamomea TaxID=663609 RepID=A0A2U1FIP5_9PSEU|nr:hypothetical protein [Actinomycetospora cinnamomea]PVZ11850.1 hypothetical protein C8D89_103180 [Actinomycetospora cinnamomea]